MTKPTIQILLIEDSQTDVLLLEEALSRDTINVFECALADCLEAGLEKLRNQTFDLVLLDLGLPDSQGLETFENLYSASPGTPMIVLSGLMDERIALKAVHSGAQDYLVKSPAGWELTPRAIRYAIERQQSQTALRETNAALQALIQASPIGIVILDSQGCVKLWSPENERIFGWNESETMGKTLPYIPEGKQEEHKQLRQRVLQGEAFTGVEVRRQKKDGSPVDISVSTAPLRDELGNIVGILGLSTDITERERAEEALRDSETRYRSLFEDSPISLWEEDFSEVKRRLDGLRQTSIADFRAYFKDHPQFVAECASLVKIVDVNKATLELYQAKVKEDLLKNLSTIFSSESYDTFVEELTHILEGDSRFEWEGINRTVKGERLDISLTWSVVPGYEDDLSRVVVSVADLTKRKQAEDALRASEAKYRLLAENMDDVVWTVDNENRFTYISPSIMLLRGMSVEEALQETVAETMTPESFQTVLQVAEQGLNTESQGNDNFVARFEIEQYCKGGGTVWVECVIKPLIGVQGQRIGILGVSRNITERKRAEEALHAAEAKNRTLIEQIPAITYIASLDENSRATYVSPQIGELGFTPEEWITGLWAEQLHPFDRERVLAEVLSSHSTTRPFNSEYRLLTRNGQVRWYHDEAIIIHDAQGQPGYLQGVMFDITERKQAEEKLNQSENRYRLATNATNDVIWEWNAKTNQLVWTENSQDVFGYSADEIASNEKWWDEHLHPDEREQVVNKLNALIAGNETIWSEEYRFLLKDGSYAYISDYAYVERDANAEPLRMIGAMSNITERKRAEAAIQQRNAELTALNQIGQALNKLAKPAEILELIFAVIGQVLDNRNLYIALFDETKQSISFPIYLINGERMEDRDRPLGNGITDYIIRNNKPVLVKHDQIETLSQLGINPMGAPSRSYLGVPMVAGDKVIGVIAVQDYEQDNVYDGHHLELLTTVAAQATVALENARLYSAVQQELEERKQAEEKLRQSEERYRQIVETAKEGIIAFDTSWRVSFANARMAEMLGYDQDEMLGIHIKEFVFDDDLKAHEGRKALREAGVAGTREGMYRTKSGAPVWMLLSITPVLEEGKFAGVFMMATDITERKQAEKLLIEGEKRYRTTLNNMMEGCQIIDHDWRYIYVNDTAAKQWHSAPENLLMRTMLDSYPGIETTDLFKVLRHCMEARVPQRMENQFIFPDGTTSWFELGIQPVPEGLFILSIDITERKRAEKALQESEQRFRSLYNNATIGLYRTTPDGRILLSNPAAIRLLGYESFDELAHRNLEQEGFEPDYSRREFRERMERDGQVIGLESKWFKKDGSTIFVRESATAVRDGLGEILFYDGTFEDITEWKRVEEAIRLSEKKFKTLFEIAPVGISVMDRKGKIVDANYSLQMITGLRKNKIVNGSNRKRTYLRPDGTVMPPDEFASTRALNENMPIFDVETGIVTEDRGVVWTQVSAAPLEMPDASLVVVTQDISERKQTEQALRRRLAELETLYESGLSLSQLLEPKEIGQKIIDVLAEKLDWYHTTVRLYHPESDSLELVAYNVAGKITDQELHEFGDRFRSMIARSGDGLSGWALQHGETVRCGDIFHDPRYVETVPGLRSGLYVPIKTGERAIGVISVESEKPDFFTAEDEHLAVTLAAQAAVALDNIRLFKDLQKSNESLLRAYDRTIEGWSYALDLRDKETEGHTQRVTILSEELARVMGVSEADIVHIRWGALLHDIGKMGVPDRILLKPDKLTDDEWVIMRQHPVHAFNLLSRIEFLQPALNIPHHHHERWDGSGYPDGLQGEQIPLEARIFAVIDVYDALTSDRPYRPAWPEDKALTHIFDQSGSHFDPQVVDVFMKLIKRS